MPDVNPGHYSVRGNMGVQKGQIVRITQPRKDHTYRFYARVTWTKEIDAGTYFGYEPVEPPSDQYGMPRHACATWGCTTVRREPKPFSPTVEVWAPSS